MSYALVVNDAVVSVGGLPRSARRLDTGDWVMGLATAPVPLQAACGFLEVVDVPQPPDTPTDTFDRSVELVAGVPTVVWTQRPKTAAELETDRRAGAAGRVSSATAGTIAAGAASANSVPALRTQVEALAVLVRDLMEANGFDVEGQA